MKRLILPCLFILSGIILFANVDNYGTPSQFMGFVVSSDTDYLSQVKDSFKVGLSAGLMLCGVLSLVFSFPEKSRPNT